MESAREDERKKKRETEMRCTSDRSQVPIDALPSRRNTQRACASSEIRGLRPFLWPSRENGGRRIVRKIREVFQARKKRLLSELFPTEAWWIPFFQQLRNREKVSGSYSTCLVHRAVNVFYTLYGTFTVSFFRSRKISGGRKRDAFQASSVIRETKSEKISSDLWRFARRG